MAHIPYGYRIVGGKAQIDPDEKERLEVFFDSYLSGASIENAEREAGINLSRSSMAKLMKNPIYLGTDYYPAMIDQASFDTVAEEMAARNSHHNPRGVKIKARPVMTRFSFADEKTQFDGLSAVEMAASLYNRIKVAG